MNFLFMFVELIYGYWTNSLGLISDAGTYVPRERRERRERVKREK